ncbi:MAG: MaoC family dehydratase N-terminal domain-containing protein [Pseudomonadota bacterium]
MSIETQSVQDIMDTARARALQATLGSSPTLNDGDTLPPFFHQAYFWDPKPPEELGRDGHPKLGGLVPDMGLPRRMWAGGQLEFKQPLIVGKAAERRSSIANAEHKQGRSGPLAFVKLRHEYWQEGECAVTEHQDLVYREDKGSGSKPVPPKARIDENHSETFSASSTMLFRYSALTFNGHRIHYDETYAKEVEGYNGLVVHGPLLAQMLMLLAESKLGRLMSFNFRSTSPLMHHEKATLCWREDGTCWVRGSDGRQCMQAKAI